MALEGFAVGFVLRFDGPGRFRHVLKHNVLLNASGNAVTEVKSLEHGRRGERIAAAESTSPNCTVATSFPSTRRFLFAPFRRGRDDNCIRRSWGISPKLRADTPCFAPKAWQTVRFGL